MQRILDRQTISEESETHLPPAIIVNFVLLDDLPIASVSSVLASHDVQTAATMSAHPARKRDSKRERPHARVEASMMHGSYGALPRRSTETRGRIRPARPTSSE